MPPRQSARGAAAAADAEDQDEGPPAALAPGGLDLEGVLARSLGPLTATLEGLSQRLAAVEQQQSGGAPAALAPEPAAEPEEPAAAGAGGLGELPITEDRLIALLSGLADPRVTAVADPIPWSAIGPDDIKTPQRILALQAEGRFVPTDLLQTQEIAADVTGYRHLSKGAAAELDYWYVVVKRQHDLLRHFERALAGEVEFDLRRAHEVLAECQSLAVERLGGIKHRAYVMAEKPAGETDETAKRAMDRKHESRKRPPTSVGWGIDAKKMDELTDLAYAKKVAQQRANDQFRKSGLGGDGRGKKGGGGKGGAAAPDD